MQPKPYSDRIWPCVWLLGFYILELDGESGGETAGIVCDKNIKQVKNFVYLGGNISENGRVEVEVRRRIQAGANAWRNVEGVMMDRKISRKLKGKVLDSCVVPARNGQQQGPMETNYKSSRTSE